MAPQEIANYLAALGEPERTALPELRRSAALARLRGTAP
jgi:hypothetical protein